MLKKTIANIFSLILYRVDYRRKFLHRHRIRVFFLVAATMLLFSCKTHKENNHITPCRLQVSDFRPKTLRFTKEPSRIVCLIESALSAFYMLNAEDRIVGVPLSVYQESTADYYAAMDDRIRKRTLPAPGNWDFASLEKIISLQPDLVILWASQQESIALLEERGIPVYAVYLSSFKDVYKEIADFGLLTGKLRRADSLILYTRQEMQAYAGKTVNIKERKKVYFMWSQGPLETSGTRSTVNELIELAGARNVCEEEQEHLVVNMEKVLQWNPDVVVMWYNSSRNPEDIYRMTEWRKIKAIQKQQVYELPSVFFCDLWTLKYQFAVKLLSLWCYPEIVEKMNIEEERKKMLHTLYGNKSLKFLR